MKNFQLLSVLLLLSSSHFLCVGIRESYPRTEEDVSKAFEELDKKLVLILADSAKSRESFLLALDAEVKEGPITTRMNNAPQRYGENGDFDYAKKEAYEALELAKKVAYDRCSKETEDALADGNLDSYKKQIRIAYAQRSRDTACDARVLETDAYVKAFVTISDRIDAAARPLCSTWNNLCGTYVRQRFFEEESRELTKKHNFDLFKRCHKIK